jgi:hypothetical protein
VDFKPWTNNNELLGIKSHHSDGIMVVRVLTTRKV